MWLCLRGSIITPIITKTAIFTIQGCKAIITKPKRKYYTKIMTAQPMYPYSLQGFLGDLELWCEGNTRSHLHQKLAELLQIQFIGRKSCEGIGQIHWLSGEITQDFPYHHFIKRKMHIRHGLPHNLSQSQQSLLQYGLLHDFFTTPKHRSKIYIEPQLKDMELISLLQQHHDRTQNSFIQEFQHYDHLASIITRRHRSPTITRYKWNATRKIDFEQLADSIQAVASNVWKLYEFILHSEDLDLINESLEYGHNSLKTHLLVIANLMVNDFTKNTKHDH